jgi:hypothetical protein
MGMVSRFILIGWYALFMLLAGLAGPAAAQIPAHTPGTICFTPNFWCWAPEPGPPGSACACPTQNGWVEGKLG